MYEVGGEEEGEKKPMDPAPLVCLKGSFVVPRPITRSKKYTFWLLQLKKLNNSGIMKLRTNTIRSARVEYPPGLC